MASSTTSSRWQGSSWAAVQRRASGLDEGAIQRYVGDKLYDLLAAAEVPRGQNAVGNVGPELGRG